ncbi:MAG: hypothetical protein LBD51_05315, partial [Bifidobacteriaceae bacterium]|nr:hypothetical protein [Bifidobacteriaceae bacterium]
MTTTRLLSCWIAAALALGGASAAAAEQPAPGANTSPLAAPGAITGAACAAGQGVTVAVDFYPLRDQLDIRCAPNATGSPADAFAAAGFDFGYNSWGGVGVIDGVDAADLGPQGWWTFLTSTSNGEPGGLPAAEWTDAAVGVGDGAVETGEAYMLRLLDTYGCWDPSSMEDPSVCVPRLALADLLDRDGSSTVPAPPWQGGAPADAAASAGWLAAQLAANGDVLPGAAGAD